MGRLTTKGTKTTKRRGRIGREKLTAESAELYGSREEEHRFLYFLQWESAVVYPIASQQFSRHFASFVVKNQQCLSAFRTPPRLRWLKGRTALVDFRLQALRTEKRVQIDLQPQVQVTWLVTAEQAIGAGGGAGVAWGEVVAIDVLPGDAVTDHDVAD